MPPEPRMTGLPGYLETVEDIAQAAGRAMGAHWSEDEAAHREALADLRRACAAFLAAWFHGELPAGV